MSDNSSLDSNIPGVPGCEMRVDVSLCSDVSDGFDTVITESNQCSKMHVNDKSEVLDDNGVDISQCNVGVTRGKSVKEQNSSDIGCDGEDNFGLNEEFSSTLLPHVLEARAIFDKVMTTEKYNFQSANIRVPSGLNIKAWEDYLSNYTDHVIVDYLQYGWPISFDRMCPSITTERAHPSGRDHPKSVDFYIETELSHGALLGPFNGKPITHLHTSPIMSRPKKGSEMRRIVLNLSWPEGFSDNNGIDGDTYLDAKQDFKLPTIDMMEKRVLQLGRGAYLYKTDLSRGYRQLRVDPYDWPLLGFVHKGQYFIDICPSFGLRSAAMMMQRTLRAASYIHKRQGYESYPYIDNFGGGERDLKKANDALDVLQNIMVELGLAEAKGKVCRPSQSMVWLGILFDTLTLTMSIPEDKLEQILNDLKWWNGQTHATRKQMQSLIGSLQFVAKVSPPVRLFINRMFEGPS